MMNISPNLTYTSLDHLSVEVNSDDYLFPLDQYSATPNDSVLDPLFDLDFFTSDMNIAGICESSDIVASINHPVEVNEFNKYLGFGHVSNSVSDIDQNLLAVGGLPVYGYEKHKRGKSVKKPISLSSSVGVGAPLRVFKASHKIEIVNPLEDKYRPRYKSDYFAQSGIKRKPRYVADGHGNHYVMLKVPLGIRGKIRVDWLTIPDANGNRYFMPYRFQVDYQSTDVTDCNPIMEDIIADNTGIVKLYLVLIKAKQDALKSLQPLTPFHPMKDALGIVEKDSSEKSMVLTPKKLIQKYQLGKSQLAFTLCVLTMDGQSYAPEWDTTVYSTVLEEEAADTPTEKTIACPHCSTSITVNDDGLVVQEVTANKRKSIQTGGGKGKITKKQKNLSEPVYWMN